MKFLRWAMSEKCPLIANDLVLEAEHRGTCGQDLHPSIDGLLLVNCDKRTDITLLHKRVNNKEA